MRILIYGINYAPELTGIGKYTGEMASWLASRDHEVKVVTTPPYYPAWRVGEGYSSRKYRREEGSGGVRVWRCPLWVPKNPSGLKRLVHLGSFALASFPVLMAQILWRPEIILVVEPPLFCAPGALLAARLRGAVSWLHVQDFEIDAAFELGLLKSKLMRNIVLKFESALMRRFHIVSSISDRMVAKLREKKVKESSIRHFPNWVDTEEIRPQKGRNDFREELGIPDDKVVVLYSGNMGEKQGLDIILKAAARLSSRRDIVFVMCGDGSARSRLQASGKGLPNLLWLPLQPGEKLNSLLGMADIHLLPQRSDAEDLVMPSKLLGMMASGRPSIATANQNTQIARILVSAGIVTTPGDEKQFADAILALADDPAGRKKLGGNARKYAVARFGFSGVLHDFENDLLEAAGCGGRSAAAAPRR